MNPIRLAILGGGAVGKSAMTIQFLQNHFVEIYDPTIEDSYRKQIAIEGHSYFIEILDTAGQEEYSAMRDQYMQSADGFLLVYDITKYDSYLYLREIIEKMRQLNESKKKICMVLCGNKCDLDLKRVVIYHEGKMLALENKCSFYETSARLGIHIDDAWKDLICQVVQERSMNQKQYKKVKHYCNIL
jgi:GTPase KRas protein